MFSLALGKEPIHAFTWSNTNTSLYYATRTSWTNESESAYKNEWKDVIEHRDRDRGDPIYRVDFEDLTQPRIEIVTNILLRVVELIFTGEGSIEGEYRDTQGRLYSLNVIDGGIYRWPNQFTGSITNYALLEHGQQGVIILGQLNTEVQVYTQQSPTSPLIKQTGWNGTYEKLVTTYVGNLSTIAFIHSSLDTPQEVYFINSIDRLNTAQIVTKENEIFTQHALSNHQMALEIRCNYLPPNHPDLAQSYNNIGLLLHNMRDYANAFSYYEMALEIWKKLFPLNHPASAQTYINIGTLHKDMVDYPAALSYYDQAAQILEISEPLNHPLLATVYNNMGSVHENLKNNLKALSNYQKALELWQQSLPSNHPNLAAAYNNIAGVHKRLTNYPTALSFYNQALEILQKSPFTDYSLVAATHNNIGCVYMSMKDTSKALFHYQEALKIWQHLLPVDHPNLAVNYNNIAEVYATLEDYPTALSYYERSVQIGEFSLPANHPHIALFRKNLERLRIRIPEFSAPTT
ncbi:unnamed protein product [Rotaria sp. Silwood1]|nr:unnamed protein product [Rotaria sp. Silwood1]